MLRSILAVIVAVVIWFIVATIGSWILRAVIPGLLGGGGLDDLHVNNDDLPTRPGSDVFIVCGFHVRNYRAQPSCSQDSCSDHADPISAEPLHALGEFSDPVPRILFDYARTDDDYWSDLEKEDRTAPRNVSRPELTPMPYSIVRLPTVTICPALAHVGCVA